jgi:hypothetical protein
MNKKKLIMFIRESKNLIRDATPDQKLKFAKLVRESLKEIKKEQTLLTENSDFLPEK